LQYTILDLTKKNIDLTKAKAVALQGKDLFGKISPLGAEESLISSLNVEKSLTCLVLQNAFLGPTIRTTFSELKELKLLVIENCDSNLTYYDMFQDCEKLLELHLRFGKEEKNEIIVLEKLPKCLQHLKVEGIFEFTQNIHIIELHSTEFKYLKVWQTSQRDPPPMLAISCPKSRLHTFETNF